MCGGGGVEGEGWGAGGAIESGTQVPITTNQNFVCENTDDSVRL